MYFRENTNWFPTDTPVNATNATVSIGEGENGVVTVEYDKLGYQGNVYSI